MKKKNCTRCRTDKPLDEFRKAPTIFGGDGRSKKCKACLAIERDERKAARGQETPTNEPEDPAVSATTIPFAMGVTARWNDEDLVLEQENEGEIHTIYLAPHVIDRVLEFYTLASTPKAPACASAEHGSAP